MPLSIGKYYQDEVCCDVCTWTLAMSYWRDHVSLTRIQFIRVRIILNLVWKNKKIVLMLQGEKIQEGSIPTSKHPILLGLTEYEMSS